MNLETTSLLPFFIISLKRLIIRFIQRSDTHCFQIGYNILRSNTATLKVGLRDTTTTLTVSGADGGGTLEVPYTGTAS